MIARELDFQINSSSNYRLIIDDILFFFLMNNIPIIDDNIQKIVLATNPPDVPFFISNPIFISCKFL